MIEIALIGSPEREELRRLAIRLEERGAKPVLVDVRKPPAFVLEGKRVEACGTDLSGVRGLFVVDLGLPPALAAGPSGELDLAASRAAARRSQETNAGWTALLEHFRGRAEVINPPATYELHGLKPYEVGVYDELGWRAPATVATRDPRDLLALGPRSGPEGWIRKGLCGGYGYTERFDPPREEAVAAALVAQAPALVQERIQGETARAYVLAGRVLGVAEMTSSQPGEIDSRRGGHRVTPITLPAAVEIWVRSVPERWGMVWAGVDLMRDAHTGEWVLLECNSAPFFVAFERATGFDFSSAIADHLLRRARRT